MNSNLTVRQAILWFALYQIGSAYLVLPAVITAVAKQDAWLSIPVSLGFHLLLIPLYASIARQMQGKSFVEHLRCLFGPLGGTISIVFIFFFPFLVFIMTLRNLGDFITIAIMPETPSDAIYFIMLIVIYFAVRSGPAVIGRCAEILFFFLLVLYLLVRFTLLSDTTIDNVLPIFEYGLNPIVLASFNLFAFPYLEAILYLFFAQYIPDPKKWRKTVITCALISGGMYFFMVLQIIAVMSEGVVSNLTFPTFFINRTISNGEFLQRFEIFVAVFWFVTIFFRLALLLYVSAQGLADAFRLRSANSLLVPLILIALAMVHSIWPNMQFLIKFFSVWPFYAMIFGIVFPIVLWLVGKVSLNLRKKYH
ncbi:endospore germination permease [Paenibacillus polymyxa]|uniref:GerAB/ArcD/ProY family transporter n=1 Tax=Paenibacillus polymyxa TaxID=1406 RepID=UPI002AB52DBC|nr:endospore germination permease [Paenibacillus polymyxa]MDY7994092.1 endospore germination permease [Paenibacillus polymyxa]MDY8120831.1 endospore germination permease [Paenibacillus polymyxa]